MIIRFTIGLCRLIEAAEGMGFEPIRHLAAPHGLANRPGEPYPATFQKVHPVLRSFSGLQIAHYGEFSPAICRHDTGSIVPGRNRALCAYESGRVADRKHSRQVFQATHARAIGVLVAA